MKKSMIRSTLLLALLSFPLLTGCSTIDKAYDKEVVTVPGQAIRTNTVFVTNVVVLPPVTNTVTGDVAPAIVRQVVTPTITVDFAPATTVTNLVPRAAISNTIEVVRDLPIPWAGVLGGVLAAIYSGYAAIRNKKTAVALVQSYDAARRILRETPEGQKLDAKMTAVMANHQQLAGVIGHVKDLLDQHTSPQT